MIGVLIVFFLKELKFKIFKIANSNSRKNYFFFNFILFIGVRNLI